MTPRALKAWRLRLDLSQEGLARWLGVSRSTVNRWEAGTQAIPKMVALVEREHTANQPDPTDTECGCIRGVQACDYHAAGMGGRWRADAEERRVHVGHRRAAGDRRVNRFSPADKTEERYEDCDRCGERYHGEFIDGFLRDEERPGDELWRVCCAD